MSLNINNKLINKRRPKVINKTFDDFRNELLNYASSNFPDQIRDFSEASIGGMFIDFAASIGESMSFYLEQQFDELNYETSVNRENIKRHLRQAGITKNISSPSIVNVDFYVEVISLNNTMEPDLSSVPVINKETILSTENNVSFVLQEDIDFSVNPRIQVGDVDNENNILTLILTKKGTCISGEIKTEVINFRSDANNLFLRANLSEENISSIIKVTDGDLNNYYEVEYLSQDTIYEVIENSKNKSLQLKYASHRFVREQDFDSGRTILRFGNGKDQSLKDNILTNPEDIALPITGRGYDSNFSLDPNNLLKTNTLGISPQGKRLSIKYRFGGGSNHNVPANSINTLDKVNITFPNMIVNNEEVKNLVLESLSVNNEDSATGGSNRLSLEELVQFIPSYKKMQNRIINQEDLISRIYTMPADFGRVSRVAILDNPYSNLSKNLCIVCKDISGYYTHAPDDLKINLKNYINTFRIIGDAYNIIDSPIYNIGIDLSIKVKSGYEAANVLNNVYFKIVENIRFDNLHIGEAINVNDIIFLVLSVDGVTSIITDKKDIIVNKNSNNNFYEEDLEENITYSKNRLSIYDNYESGLVYPKENGIFELKYEDFDIKVRNG